MSKAGLYITGVLMFLVTSSWSTGHNYDGPKSHQQDTLRGKNRKELRALAEQLARRIQTLKLESATRSKPVIKTEIKPVTPQEREKYMTTMAKMVQPIVDKAIGDIQASVKAVNKESTDALIRKVNEVNFRNDSLNNRTYLQAIALREFIAKNDSLAREAASKDLRIDRLISNQISQAEQLQVYADQNQDLIREVVNLRSTIVTKGDFSNTVNKIGRYVGIVCGALLLLGFLGWIVGKLIKKRLNHAE